jgi:hypothetical protein
VVSTQSTTRYMQAIFFFFFFFKYYFIFLKNNKSFAKNQQRTIETKIRSPVNKN